jgi:NAD(P)-dependent dehydrogenase (short-subunit alcohol dehydrogenase family)
MGEPMDGKVVLLTGGTSGIGREAALALAERGASVAVVGRDRERGREVASEIDARNADGFAEFYNANLASQRAIRRLTDEFRARHERLDALVNNAGTFRAEREESPEKIEATLAINHLAPVLLTHRLADLLVESAPARVVTVSSGLHEKGEIRFGDLLGEREYDPWDAYNQSKLANVLFARELAERFPDGVSSNALNPGFVPATALDRQGSLRGRAVLAALSRLPLPSARTVEEGAKSIVRAVADPDLEEVTGAYLHDGKPVAPSDDAQNERARKRLWDVSSGLAGVSPDAPPLQP